MILLLLACAHPTACESYVAAVAECAVARGVDPALYDADAVCAEWDDTREDHYGEWYTCRASAYAGEDCTTDAGWAAAIQADACCTPPGGSPSSDPTCP